MREGVLPPRQRHGAGCSARLLLGAVGGLLPGRAREASRPARPGDRRGRAAVAPRGWAQTAVGASAAGQGATAPGTRAARGPVPGPARSALAAAEPRVSGGRSPRTLRGPRPRPFPPEAHAQSPAPGGRGLPSPRWARRQEEEEGGGAGRRRKGERGAGRGRGGPTRTRGRSSGARWASSATPRRVSRRPGAGGKGPRTCSPRGPAGGRGSAEDRPPQGGRSRRSPPGALPALMAAGGGRREGGSARLRAAGPPAPPGQPGLVPWRSPRRPGPGSPAGQQEGAGPWGHRRPGATAPLCWGAERLGDLRAEAPSRGGAPGCSRPRGRTAGQSRIRLPLLITGPLSPPRESPERPCA